MGTINYKHSSLLASETDGGIMSSGDKTKLDLLSLDGYTTILSLQSETSRAELAETELRIAADGYATILYVDGYACSNTDARLSDYRIPIEHASIHIAGGRDSIDGYYIVLGYSPVNYSTPVDGYIGEHIARIDSKISSLATITFVDGYGSATESSAGYMSAGDKTKLDGIPISAGGLTGNLDGYGYSISNFKSGGSASNLALTGLTPGSFFAVTLAGLGASKIYQVTYGFRIGWILDSNHASNWSGDIVIDGYITTDGSSVATVGFNTTPIFDSSRLSSAGSGSTATVVASAGGFTVTATGVAGNTHAWYEYFVMKYRDVT
jgi:hypothetical protein